MQNQSRAVKTSMVVTNRHEHGAAMVTVLLTLLILSALTLSLAFSGLNEITASADFEGHVKALLLADAGFNIAKGQLGGASLNEMLAAESTIPIYIPAEDSNPNADRNARWLTEIRRIDFSNPPSAIGTITVTGLLTPANGFVLGEGRFFARISDNDDGDGDPTVDSDRLAYLRVAAAHRGAPSEKLATGATTRNAVAVVEGLIRFDESFQLNAPLTVVAPEISSFFSGNSFDIVGGEDRAGISFLSPTGNAENALQTTYDSLSSTQHNNITGAEGPYGSQPSLRDDTEALLASGGDQANLLDPVFLSSIIQRAGAIADLRFTEDVHLSGDEIAFGTPQSPKIVIADGDLTLSGDGSGAGILIVKGTLKYNGAFDYDGLILVVGEGSLEMSGANKTVTGGILLARLEEVGGSPTFGRATLDLRGNSNIIHTTPEIEKALGLLPPQTLAWREITPEIEPGTLN